MQDRFGRNIDYMRISVTDRCNLRCRYCMPEGTELTTMEELLTFEEICRVVDAASGLGIRHIKLTGGEPLVRRGLPTLLRMIRQTEGIEKVTLTTNGILLRRYMDELLEAGLDAVNISLDSLDPSQYEQITGQDALDEVLAAIDLALEKKLPVKINAVSLDLGESSVKNLISLAKEKPLDVRFIEMMPIGRGKDYPVMSHKVLLEKLEDWFPGLETDKRIHGFGPAVYYRIPGYRGSVGLISAIHGKFCGSCNRVRLTSTGFLKACLCYNKGEQLITILRADGPEEKIRMELVKAFRNVIEDKPQAHCFENGEEITERSLMSAIGG